MGFERTRGCGDMNRKSSRPASAGREEAVRVPGNRDDMEGGNTENSIEKLTICYQYWSA